MSSRQKHYIGGGSRISSRSRLLHWGFPFRRGGPGHASLTSLSPRSVTTGPPAFRTNTLSYFTQEHSRCFNLTKSRPKIALFCELNVPGCILEIKLISGVDSFLLATVIHVVLVERDTNLTMITGFSPTSESQTYPVDCNVRLLYGPCQTLPSWRTRLRLW